MIRMRRRAPLIGLLLAFVLGISGCGLGSPAPTPTPRPSSTATLKILQPASAAVVKSNQLHVQFDLKGGRIVQDVSRVLPPDEGHIHLSIDGQIISMNYALEQDISLQSFAAGPHVLQGEFVAKDHAPFNPRVLVKLIFDYEPS
jgi:hypothetical protein